MLKINLIIIKGFIKNYSAQKNVQQKNFGKKN